MREICSELNGNRPLVVRAVFSSPDAGAEYTRIVLRPVSVKGGDGWQAERFSGVKVFHLNLTAAELSGWLEETGTCYRQIAVAEEGRTLTYSKRAGGGYKVSVSGNKREQFEKTRRAGQRQEEAVPARRGRAYSRARRFGRVYGGF